jgi:uncharacterized protein (TIGR00297 family)
MLDLAGVLLSILVLAGISLLVLVTRTLDAAGMVVALIVGSAILFFGGWEWFTLLLLFFLSSGLATRYKLEQKRRIGSAESQMDTRGWRNVAANGAVSATLAVAYGATHHQSFAFAYLGAVSTSMADTLATELGLLNPYEPRLITNLSRKVHAGTSGAVSPYGEVSASIGAVLISFTALVLGFGGSKVAIVFISSLAGGFLGSTFDSLLGATVQATYICKVCCQRVERSLHCGEQASLESGLHFMDNNVVNFFSTLFGASMVVLLNYLLSVF